MLTPQFILALSAKLVIDLFAGGGGASTGIEKAIGRHVDIAVNHDADAIGMHEKNHPQTRHFRADVWEVDPLAVVRGQQVGLLHASPDCTDHSQAKGGQPRSKKIRALAWVVHRWAGKVRPDVITLENVEQMLQWSPLIAKRDPKTGRVVTLDEVVDPVTKRKSFRVAEAGEHVPRHRQFLVADKKKLGRNWGHFVEGLRAMGYVVQWRVICNADLGAHSTRTRLYMVARCDGLPIVWPEKTHAKRPTGKLKAHRPAAECINWSIQGQSIFNRKKPLADATMRRIAHGMRKFVLDCPEPFIVNNMANNVPRPVSDPIGPVLTGGHKMLLAPTLVPVTHTRDVAFDVREPQRTITTAKGGETALAAAVLVQMGYGERDGQAPRVLDLQKALGTVTAGGKKHGLTTAFMVQANGGFNTTHARDVREPVSAVTASGSQQQLITAHLTTLRRNSEGRDARDPLTTIAAAGEHQALVEYHLGKEHEEGALRCAAFLMRYHASGGQWADLRDPATTITTHDRLALVTVWLKGEPWVIVDICLRMLTPRELYNAQDFPPTYTIDRTASGKLLTKTAQVRMCGNSVSPLPMRLLVAANYSDYGHEQERKAA
ncbi:DNA cytosine methyltransferase [Variovorax sp. NFACC27]|uniref:DNA cytosine methyltransferase n=1 Tax=unclassified Variovorax TaxID=663243 RepID=UPI0008967B12|nr:DNA (cytosine-5)-methyltransferase 1 [Variovorax sp. NFACC28]SEG78004.1 DNA (cytosine-5)-methyltransferase 1 [Variovorax sp. NFACC29]SFC96280.1 DNA (cytosine-5)-methyltransferase 1 [Variovorax sp. NFACC26]SFG09331.1 DNA (cytosine-5)-methyltransferase 1 [Variovorax sp. NFACC27]